MTSHSHDGQTENNETENHCQLKTRKKTEKQDSENGRMTWNEGKGDQAGKADRKQADTLFPDEFGDSPFPGQGCLWSCLVDCPCGRGTER